MSLKSRKKISCPNSDRVLNKIANGMNEICECLDRMYDTNCGGCCYIAYCLSKLLQRDNIDYELVILSYDEIEEGDEIAHFQDCYTHYAIQIGKFSINRCDYDEDCCYVRYLANQYPSDIKEHYENCSWNCCYDTDENEFIWNTLKSFYDNITKDLRKG